MKKLLVLTLLLLGSFGLAACEQETDETQGITDTTVTVGNSAVQSGGYAIVGTPFNQGVQAYFDMVNDDGGVAGRSIEFITYDDEFNGTTGFTYAERLVEDDEIFAFVGHFGTPTVSQTLDYLIEEGIPQVYYATGISALYNENAEGNERASFPVQPIYDTEGRVMVARALAEFDAAKIGVIYTNDDAGTGILSGVQKEAENQDITLVEAQVAADAVDMSAAATTIVDGDVDLVIVAANQVPADIAIKALNSAGNTSPAIVSYVNAAPTFVEGIAAVLENFDVYSSAWVNIFNEDGSTTDEYNLFVTEISKTDAELAANPYAMAGWIAASFFVEGLERVGEDELTWDNYIDAMEESAVDNPLGAPVDFTDGRRIGTDTMAFLKATVIPGTDGADDSYLFANFAPMENLDDILAE